MTDIEYGLSIKAVLHYVTDRKEIKNLEDEYRRLLSKLTNEERKQLQEELIKHEKSYATHKKNTHRGSSHSSNNNRVRTNAPDRTAAKA